MVLRKLTVLAVGALLIGSATLASAGVPSPALSTAEMLAYSGTGTLSMFNLPNGGGRAFADAFVVGGGAADATITCTIRDGLGAAIEFFPFEDIWLSQTVSSSLGTGLSACGGNAVADANTDASGVTTFGNPLFAGGWHCQSNLGGGAATGSSVVVISGDPMTSGDLALIMNSPDINGDGATNLSDGGFFTVVLFGAYSYEADFNGDGVINVSDAGFMSAGLGASCP